MLEDVSECACVHSRERAVWWGLIGVIAVLIHELKSTEVKRERAIRASLPQQPTVLLRHNSPL